MSSGDEPARVRRQIEGVPAAGPGRSEIERLEDLADIYLASDNHDQALLQYEEIERRAEWDSLTAGDKARICYKAARAHVGLGDLESGLRLATKAEKLAHIAEDPLLVGKVHAISGQIYRRIGDQREALAHSLRALDLLRHTDQNREIAFVQLTCGSIFLRRGDLTEAVRYYQDALAAFRRAGDEEGIAKAHNNLGVAYKDLCQWENATQALKKAMEIDRRYGNYAGVALRMLNLGLIQYLRGEWDGSRRRTEKSLQMARAVGDARGVTLCSLALARIARRQGRWRESRRRALEALRLSRRQGNRREIAASYEELGAWCFGLGRNAAARSFLEKSLATAEPIAENTDHVADVCRRLSEVARASGQVEEASSLAKRSLRAAAKIGDARLIGLGLRVLAAACRSRGNSKLAAFYGARSVGIFESRGIPFDLGCSLLESARISRENGDLGSARSELARAEAIFRGLRLNGPSARVLIELARLKVDAGRFEDALVLLRKAEHLGEDTNTGRDSEEILSLRTSIEERVARDSLAETNRFLSFGESVRDRSGIVTRIARELSADRVFLFERREREGLVIGDCHGVGPESARRLLAESAQGRIVSGGPIRPFVSVGGGSPDSRARVIAPGRSGASGIYVDRLLGSSGRPFTRGDLEFLVALAREIFAPEPRPSEPVPPSNPLPGAGFDGVVTRSKGMLEILSTLRKLTGINTTILLQGETGSGKGLLAYEIARGEGSPFVTINCADLTETILEAELFGHAKNAFTGAGAAKKGLFDMAEGGTVFIDEIDKTGLKFQEKFLRVVDRREFKPVGSLDVRRVQCRIVCASNRDLREEVEKKRFLQDLYYRLKVISIRIPPLRERPEDIPLLTEHFLATFSRSMGKEGVRFADEVIRLFSRYPWPGNVRDLQNEVERAVALASSGDTVRVSSLSDDLVAFARSGLVLQRAGERTLAGMVEELEERVIREALRQYGGNKSRVAEHLGLTRKGLRNKIVRYGIEP